MPEKDGTVPADNGREKETGRPSDIGPGDTCVCPTCGAQVSLTLGTPCTSTECPQCGSLMMARQ